MDKPIPVVHTTKYSGADGVSVGGLITQEETGEQWYLNLEIEWSSGVSRDDIMIPVPKPQKGYNHYDLVIEGEEDPITAKVGVTLRGENKTHWAVVS
ncbi:MAG: hypothetical protein ABIA11_00240 [Patescibacteria group bacterium]|nr:hypothetical protein [Patescibacteria group bacterium]